MALSNRDLEQDVPHHDDDNNYTSSRNGNASSNGKMHQRNGSDGHDRATNSSSQQQQQQQQQQQLSCRLGPETFSYEPNAAASDPSKSNSSVSHGLSSLCKPTASLPRTLLLATIYASISGLLFGYQMGVTGGALHSLQSTLSLTSSQAESVSGFFFLGLMIASPFGGYACDRLGRRSTILYMDGAFAVAAAIMAVAPNYETVLAGRFLAGCASGMSLVAAVSYLTELASAEHHHAHRGALVSTVEASVSLGFLVSYLASYGVTVWGDYEEG